jgi:hypothetical protein
MSEVAMNNTRTIKFAELRRLLEDLGYKYKRTEDAEVFRISRDRLIYFRRYGDRECVGARDLANTRTFLDAWGQLDAANFDALLESTPKPA